VACNWLVDAMQAFLNAVIPAKAGTPLCVSTRIQGSGALAFAGVTAIGEHKKEDGRDEPGHDVSR